MTMNKISLQGDFQHDLFVKRLAQAESRMRLLRKYDADFVMEMRQLYEMVGRRLKVTTKQMNHLLQVSGE